MQKILMIGGAAAALMLGACSDKPTKREAGNWENQVEIVKLEMPGMPPELQDSMKQMIASNNITNYCLTPEEAAKDDLESLLNEGPGAEGECTWTTKDVKGSKVNVVGTCTQGAQKAELAMVGTMESKQSDMTITTKADAPNGQKMEMVMRVKAKHTGACKAESANPAAAAGA